LQNSWPRAETLTKAWLPIPVLIRKEKSIMACYLYKQDKKERTLSYSFTSLHRKKQKGRAKNCVTLNVLRLINLKVWIFKWHFLQLDPRDI
jgi:hypothetical protein